MLICHQPVSFDDFNPIQDELLTDGAASPKNLSRISYNDETCTVIPYLKTIQKIYESRDTTPEFR